MSSGWITNNEIDCPVPSNTDVEVRYHTGGTEYSATPQALTWHRVAAYRVVARDLEVTEEEDRGWLERERARKDVEEKLARQKDKRSELQAEAAARFANAEPVPNPARSKYHREIKPGIWVDVYDVLMAWRVINPADQHAIKKMLVPGQRGVKDGRQDRREAIDSIERAIELEADRYGR